MTDHQSIAQQVYDLFYSLPESRRADWNIERVLRDHGLPDGVTIAGAGQGRVAFRVGDHVYKVDRRRTSDHNNNRMEFENYQRVVSMEIPEGFAVPETMLIEVFDGQAVIVMQYIERDPNLDQPDWYYADAFAEATGIGDLHPENIILANDLCYIVDIGWTPR